MSACSFTNEYDRDPRGPRIRRTGPHNADASGWKYLHLAALDGKLSHNKAVQFAACIGCPDCKHHFLALLRTHPIRPMEDTFTTTVRWHNSVNRRLGAPEMDEAAARKLWNGGGMASPPVKQDLPQFSQVAMH